MLMVVLIGCGGGGASTQSAASQPRPNIVLVIMDDIGIDQWQLFGYGGTAPAATPNIDAIAQGGVRFHNMWSMPACSNGRAALFTGRYPFRTNVLTAIGNNDLANYMVNPNETTLPKLLKQRGYKSALFGKFHMGIQSNDPYGYGMVHAFGFDYFDGWLDETGDPSSIDTTAGGVAQIGTWSCGFVRDAAHGGADTGACYAGDNTCKVISKIGAEAPGRVCRDEGGIFDPNQPCNSPVPSYINFNTLSGHYVSPLDINNEDGSVERIPPTDIRARTYRGTEPVDAALDWIKAQPANQPWMVALSFATAHTPLMQPPSQLLPSTEPDSSNLDCTNVNDQRVLNNEMEEALDYEIGRFMVEAGLASRGPHGELIYHPKKTNTYVIFVTDNGSSGSVVKPPFDGTRAKSTAYQTGVWVPGIVSGPAVVQPGREVGAMVNITDLFQLIGKLAGIDAHKSVPRTLDSKPMFPYLENPQQPSLRSTNFIQIGTNLHANGAINGPCVYATTTCTQIAPTKGVCEDNNGIWWGPGATDPSTAGIPPEGLPLCCDVAVWQHDHGQTIASYIYPLEAYAIRNDHYKLVINHYQSYNAGTNACAATTSTEFYEINEDVPVPKLDTADSDLLASGTPLTSEQQKNYDVLTSQLNALFASQPACPGDINLDGVVNNLDVQQWAMFAQLSMGKSSWADLNQDGLTDNADLTIIQQHMGACPK
ncbi:MAG: sulfatase-like hydrolase/transferase [Candidatus Binataceae bacterium]